MKDNKETSQNFSNKEKAKEYKAEVEAQTKTEELNM